MDSPGHAPEVDRRQPQARWDELMPEIIDLYLNKNTLAQVRDTMASKHDFHANIPTYKRKLTAHGVRKNLTAKQKLLLLNRHKLSDSHDSRLRRPIVRNGVRFYLHASPADTQLHHFSHSQKTTEYVITATEQYYSQFHGDAGDWWSIGESFNVFRRALSQTRKNSVNSSQVPGLTMLNKACELAPLILQKPLEAIVLFAAYFSQAQWIHMPRARVVALDYFTRYARSVRSDSRVSELLLALRDDRMSNEIASLFLSIGVKTASATNTQFSAAFFEYLVDLRALAIETGGNPGPAVGQLIESILATGDRSLPDTIRLTYARAYMCFWEQDFAGAQMWNTRVLHLTNGDRSRRDWKRQRGALFQLGRIEQLAGHPNEAAAYYWDGLVVALAPDIQEGMEASDKFINLEFLEMLKLIYEGLGNFEQADLMRSRFGEVWTGYAREFNRIPPVDVSDEATETAKSQDNGG
ncbi:uncharacterized protein AB675_2782 [Cyphellophora attinorum]|uniref:Clr5 domain-containing protein n=1 Tax=Cyphellophora attinorum TaxID=1664694 RepID=A0A0N1P1N1_9EURO|nr:uncharacterized protein AB675_2782 [Phialophora attinorum]KPI45136.1 hypothetical protein AB675_2782 [Phialophora attinorum]